MKIFKHKEDKLPVAIFTAYFIADICMYLMVDNIYVLVGWFVLGIFPKANIAAWNHHHQHLTTFKQTFLNRLLEIVYASHTGITTNTWVLHHNFGHHLNYLDQEKDESRWKDKKGETMGAFRYTMVLTATSYWRAFVVGSKYPKFRTPFLYMTVIVAALLGGLIYLKPLQGIMVFLVPMLMALIMTSYATMSTIQI